MTVKKTKKTKKLGISVRPPRVRTSASKYTANGARISAVEGVTATAGGRRRAALQQELLEQYTALPASARLALNQIRDVPEEGNGLGGYSERLGRHFGRRSGWSHGERSWGNPKDLRKRRDRIAKQAYAFAGQMDDITDAYIKWGQQVADNLDRHPPPVPEAEVKKHIAVTVVDIFGTYSEQIAIHHSDVFPSASMVSQGFVPCAPYKANVAFSIRVLEIFRIAHLRTPQLSMHAWMKTVADLHGLPFKPYRAEQFSIAYDLYLGFLRRVKTKRTGRSGGWRNCCPSCMLKVEDEEELTFSILVTMDGNDSLKRVFRRESPDYDDEGKPLPGVSKERFDPRVADAGGDYFLSRERVNLWDKEEMKARADGGEDKSPCEERWKNLSDDSSKKMWAIYDETGVFICLCRHGFVLMVEDMVRSGELSKYPLAMSAELMESFGRNIGAGYDISCGFSTTLWKSLLGPRALLQNFSCLVGAFHGHAHNRLCQLKFLATYVRGLGLEDLEGCERLFSKSNANAGSVRYAGRSLMKLVQDEFKFLKSLMSEAEDDTLQMEYYQRLVNLADRTPVGDDGPEWAEAAHLVSTKRYRLALLKLERLVIQAPFKRDLKLSKMHSRPTTLQRHRLPPPVGLYHGPEVVEYAFLADFDLLRDPEKVGEVREWATPAARLLLDQYFRIERAREEITRCNVEIPASGDIHPRRTGNPSSVETNLQGSNPGLAWCVRRHRLQRESQYNEVHMKRLSTFAKKAGASFTGTLQPGVRVQKPSTATGRSEPMEDVVGPESNISREALKEMEAQAG
ncbi:hypothetical protein C8F04DRAFT_1194493 [Mycena alexandri]|uniref:CxC2-like cysteine cluster KDZ transposase-associated domain-containing protein n=1 Tax=Mycena alexandri TaxID=1745969 RepID=A0AAD6S7V8_9AGAR|nr:hypothetical protein C8F04DRAFT_1194493 [Mycena alexandri]